jgi:hypothetical protein
MALCSVALTAFASSCSAATGVFAECTAVQSLSVEVAVRDSITGAAAALGDIGTLVGTGVDDTLQNTDSLTLRGGTQLGTFTVTVNRPGYFPWIANNVMVTRTGACGNVLPVQLNARLQPATS